MTDESDDGSSGYEVGYGKPPIEHRVKKGERRNPKGRPKGSLNVLTRLKRAALIKIPVLNNGHRVTMDKLDAGLTNLMNQVASGNVRAIQLVLELLERAERRDDASTPPIDAAARAKADAEILKALKGRLLGGDAKEKDHDEKD